MTKDELCQLIIQKKDNEWLLDQPYAEFLKYYTYDETPFAWVAIGIQSMIHYACAIPETAIH